MKLRRVHTREFKIALCRRIESKETSRAAAVREHSLAPSMLGRWLEVYRAKGEEGFAEWAPGEIDKDKRIAQLEQALGQAYLDIKILKSALGGSHQGKKGDRSES